MFTLLNIKHKYISDQQLREIISIKTVAWKYSFEEHMNWINEHLSEEDIHCLLLCNKVPVAYMNLVDTTLEIDNKSYPIWGVGNVCAYETGKGYGGILMEKVNDFILTENRVGLLFCKEKLLNFYVKFNWNIVNFTNNVFPSNASRIYSMVFNMPVNYEKIQFFNRIF